MKDGNIVQIGTPEEILMSPSNEYVEKFVEDVDLSKVLTAGHIMKRAETVRIDKGPRVALQLMKNLGISSIYAVDKQKKLLGVIHAADAKKAVESDLSLQDILNTEFTTVHESTYLTEIFDVVSDANIPIAVTDDKGRMKGIVVKGALIGALSGNNDYINVEDSAEQAQDSSVQGVK